MCRHNTPVSTACLPSVTSTVAVSRRKQLASPGTRAKSALGTSSWVSSALTRPAGSGLPTALQLHLFGQLPPDGQQRAGSIGRTGQQLLKPRPFLLAARKESGGQWAGWVRSSQRPQGQSRHSHPAGRDQHSAGPELDGVGCEAGCGAETLPGGSGCGTNRGLRPWAGGTSGRKGGAALGPVCGHTGPSTTTTMTRSCCLRRQQAPCTHKTSHGSTSPAWSCRSRGSRPRGDGGLQWAHPFRRRPWALKSTGGLPLCAHP